MVIAAPAQWHVTSRELQRSTLTARGCPTLHGRGDKDQHCPGDPRTEPGSAAEDASNCPIPGGTSANSAHPWVSHTVLL